MTPLHKLARAAGLLIDWEDFTGTKQRVSDAALIRILDALGLEAGSDSAIAGSLDQLDREKRQAGASLVTADAGKAIRLPPHQGKLILESGDSRDIPAADTLAIEEPGYHRLEWDGGRLTIAVAPRRGYSVADAAPGRRIWGPAVQIPSLSDGRRESFGDFGALARFAAAAAKAGADALAISPVHALFPADATRFSPYAPSTRLFLNVLLADPSLLGDTEPADPQELIDWEAAGPRRLQRLRRLYDKRGASTRSAIEEFRRRGGEPLERHAQYDALHAHFLGTVHQGGWQAWPRAYQDPAGPAVARFAQAHSREVGFHLFLQWLADRSFAAAQAAAKDNGMAVGLIADLAVGMDAGGSHAWSSPDALLTGLSVGAPPDALGPDGQDWGITTFSPRGLMRTGFEAYIATVRAALRHAGGIRIDHAMGLRRLWVVPHGAKSSEGAYLVYPEADMMRLLALEAWRHRAIVVGEDLGTVPPGFRGEMEKRAMLGMRVLWFERTRSGSFTRPAGYSRHAAALTSTHDLPTVAGWWSGRDIDWTWKLARTSPHADIAAAQADRAADRARLWKAMRRAGIATAPAPPPGEPAAAVDAAIDYVGRTPCDLAIVPVEDLLGLAEQPNLPGTTIEHPNWRRRLPVPSEEAFEAPEVAVRVARLNQARRS
jgi:4-alpha-glucanotransferase